MGEALLCAARRRQTRIEVANRAGRDWRLGHAPTTVRPERPLVCPKCEAELRIIAKPGALRVRDGEAGFRGLYNF